MPTYMQAAVEMGTKKVTISPKTQSTLMIFLYFLMWRVIKVQPRYKSNALSLMAIYTRSDELINPYDVQDLFQDVSHEIRFFG